MEIERYLISTPATHDPLYCAHVFKALAKLARNLQIQRFTSSSALVSSYTDYIVSRFHMVRSIVVIVVVTFLWLLQLSYYSYHNRCYFRVHLLILILTSLLLVLQLCYYEYAYQNSQLLLLHVFFYHHISTNVSMSKQQKASFHLSGLHTACPAGAPPSAWLS